MTRRRFAVQITLLATLLAALGLPAAPALRAQSRKPEDIRPGRLLVANRDLRDPNFSETVILLVDYAAGGEGGAFGLVINRPTNVSVAEGLAQLRRSDEYHGPIYVGGPVQQNNVMALFHDKAEPHPRKHIFGDVYLISRKAELEAELVAAAGPDQLRLYIGYAGWGPGQLDNEVERGDWFIFNPTRETIFDNSPDTLWSRLIARTEQRMAQAR
jgi:putative transcriptional regulator